MTDGYLKALETSEFKLKTEEIIQDSDQPGFMSLLKQQIALKKAEQAKREGLTGKETEVDSNDNEKEKIVEEGLKKEKSQENIEKVKEKDTQNEDRTDFSKNLKTRLGMGNGSKSGNKVDYKGRKIKGNDFLSAWRQRKIEKRAKDVTALKKEKAKLEKKGGSKETRADKLKKAKEKRRLRMLQKNRA